MQLINNLVDWAADKVQSFTGEKERRQLVLKMKDMYLNFRKDISSAINKLNMIINDFNQRIHELNNQRQGVVSNNIAALFGFLSHFGNTKDVGTYCNEGQKVPAQIPVQKLASIEEYIAEIDWSKDEVFLDTFFLSPFGMKAKTRAQNLSIIEQINEFQLDAEETLKQINIKSFYVGIEKEICDLYIQNVLFISEFIKKKIIPELANVEAFFQVLQIKESVLSGNELLNLYLNNDITVLKDTPYSKHYYFIKNAFVFYVFSCKVYNTPILTRMLNNVVTDEDKETLILYKSELQILGRNVEDNIIIS